MFDKHEWITSRGAANVMKPVKQAFADGRQPERKFITTLSELRSMKVWVPDPEKPGQEILVPVFEGVYRNVRASSTNLLTVVMHKDRPVTAAILKKMKECFFAWMHGDWTHARGYTEKVSESLLEGLGPGCYFMASQGSTFSLDTLEVTGIFQTTTSRKIDWEQWRESKGSAWRTKKRKWRNRSNRRLS